MIKRCKYEKHSNNEPIYCSYNDYCNGECRISNARTLIEVLIEIIAELCAVETRGANNERYAKTTNKQ